MFLRFATVMTVFVLAFCAQPSRAQDDAMIEIYGQGLHRYYAGDYLEAERLLTMVVDSGTQDPRAHFFRGLSQYMQGKTHEAKFDFEAGAMAEARGKRVVNVGYALQRIQGAKRLEIEKSRQAARMAVLVEQSMARRMREEAAKAAGTPVPSTSAAAPATAPATPQAGASDATDPFGGKGALQAGQAKPDAEKSASAPDDSTNPFQDDPNQGAAPPAEAADPFGAPADPAATDAVPADAAPAEAAPADPFSTPAADAPATENPFGT